VLLNILFASFSRSHIYTFTQGQNFEPLTISGDYLGYWCAIATQVPRLDSAYPEQSLEGLNVPCAPI